ncbi:MAG TPA: hypothetical protein VGH97_05470 [Thermoanaerobaculia bacterium]|jgi:hypothetical protein
MTRSVFRIACVASGIGAWLAAPPARPQNIVPPPITITLPNYNTIPIGQMGALEGGAFAARVDDASANWFNPAGLSKATSSQISSSSGTYQFLSLVPKDLEGTDTGTSTEQVPALVGVVVKKMFGNPELTAGFAFTRTNSWTQSTTALRDRLAQTPPTLLTYSADSTFQRVEASAGLGYDPGCCWRVGAVLAGDVTTLDSQATFSTRDPLVNGLDAVQISGRASGSITHLRAAVGAQWEPTPEIRVGGLLRSPGIKLFRSGDLNADGLFTAGGQNGAQLSYTFFDKDPRFDYQLPFEAVLGAAWVRDRFELEVDGHFYAGHSPYDLFRSEQTATRITDPGGGAPPVVDQIPFQNIQADNKPIFNVAVGGHYALTANRVWLLHFGFSTDFSPVGDADQFFSRVNLYGVTLGFTGQTEHIVGSLGVNYVFGSSDNSTLAQLLDSDLKVRMIGVIYSLAYKF